MIAPPASLALVFAARRGALRRDGACDGRETALGAAGLLLAAGIVTRRLARRRR